MLHGVDDGEDRRQGMDEVDVGFAAGELTGALVLVMVFRFSSI